VLQRHEVLRLVQVRQRGDVLAVQLQQRVAVGRGAAGLVDGDEAAAAGLVVDQHALVPQARELVGDQAQHRVGAAAGREGRDQRHGLAGVVAGLAWASAPVAALRPRRPVSSAREKFMSLSPGLDLDGGLDGYDD
jgi:hypothetical protein